MLDVHDYGDGRRTRSKASFDFGYKLEEARMHELRFDRTWVSQIQHVRNDVTNPTKLIRPDRSQYRVCHSGASTFSLRLWPGFETQRRGCSELLVGEKDLYVREIDGYPFGRYSSTLDTLSPSALALSSAVVESQRPGPEQFNYRSLVVLCVAESLRSDKVANRIQQLIAISMSGATVSAPLPLGWMLRDAHAWGQTSDEVFRVVSDEARSAALASQEDRTPQQQRISEEVHVERINVDLRSFAETIRVLKRPD